MREVCIGPTCVRDSEEGTETGADRNRRRTPPMTDFADAEPRKGREALSDARTLREADGSTAGVVDRVYFAAFHAVRTVLSVRGSLPDDEDHVPAQFAENVVVAEETSMEDARFLILSAVIPYRPFRCTGR
jgi:hypothetical protein